MNIEKKIGQSYSTTLNILCGFIIDEYWKKIGQSYSTTLNI